MEKHIHLHLYTGGGVKAPPAKDAVVATPVVKSPTAVKPVVPKVQPVQPMVSQPQEHDCSCGGKPRMPVSR